MGMAPGVLNADGTDATVEGGVDTAEVEAEDTDEPLNRQIQS